MMRTPTIALLTALLLLPLGAQTGATSQLPLRIQGDATRQAPRWERLASGGIPLPPTLQTPSAEALVILDAEGNEVPADLRITARFPATEQAPGRARWLHVTLPEKVREPRLVRRTGAPRGPRPFPRLARVLPADSGRLLGHVRGAPGASAAVSHVTLTMLDEKRRSVPFKTTDRVEEWQGRLGQVTRLEGTLGEKLRATVRIHQTRGSPVVRIDVRLENPGSWDPSGPGVAHLRGLRLRIGSLEEANHLLDGTSELAAPVPLKIRAPGEPDLAPPRLPWISTRGEETVRRGRRHPGFVALGTSSQTIVVGRPRAALEAPTGWDFDARGVTAWLLPPEGHGPFYGGQWGEPKKVGKDSDPRSKRMYRFEGARWKTFSVFLAVRPGLAEPADLRALRAEAERPPLVSIDPHTACFEAQPGILMSPFEGRTASPGRARYQRWLRLLVDDAAADPRRGHGRVGLPRFLERGATYENRNPFGWFDAGDVPWGNGYSSVHYDLPRSLFAAWVASGDRRFFDRGVFHVLHQRDLDMVHGSKSGRFQGGQRYEKGYYHGNFGRPLPSHHWITGLYLHWVLTAEDGTRQALEEAGEYLLGLGLGAWSGRFGARNLGWPVDSMVTMYLLTGDVRYDRAIRRALKAFEEHEKGRGYVLNSGAAGRRGANGDMRGWMHAIVISAICRHVDATGDRSFLPLVRRMCDHLTGVMVRRSGVRDGRWRRARVLEHWAPDRNHRETQPGWYLVDALSRAAHHLDDPALRATATDLFECAVRWTQTPMSDPRGLGDTRSWPPMTFLMSSFPNSEGKIFAKVGRLGMAHLHHEARHQRTSPPPTPGR